MIKLTFENQEVFVPESWSDIRLSDYEHWFATQPQSRIDQVKLVAQICNMSAEPLLQNPTQLFDTICDTVSFAFEEYRGTAKNEIRIGDKNYVISFTDELTLAEWVDIESVYENGENAQSYLSDILAILCRPQGEVYDSKKCSKRKQMFGQLTMDKVLPLLAFFLLQKERYQIASNLYSEVKALADQYLHHIQIFAESGAGTKSLPIWQKIKYYFLTKSLKKQLSKYSDSCFTA